MLEMDVPCWTVADVARWANVGERSVYLAVRNGSLRAARVNGRGTLRFAPAWVREWFAASSLPPQGVDAVSVCDAA